MAKGQEERRRCGPEVYNWGRGLTLGLVGCGKFGPLRLGLVVEGLQTMLRSLDFLLLALASLSGF